MNYLSLIYKNTTGDPEWYEPRYAHDGDSGFDAHAVEGFYLNPGETQVVKTGWSFVIPEGFEIQARSRSGLAAKRGVMVLNSPGTIDSGYRNEVGIILHNTSGETFRADRGDRIAQLVVAPVFRAQFDEWPSDMELPDSARGMGGFGSTGIRWAS